MIKPLFFSLLFLIGLGGCGGGGGEEIILAEAEAVFDEASGGDVSNQSCSPDCSLSASDVERIIGQAVAEAERMQVGATISVSDRVGNILGVYQMASANPFVTVTSTEDFGGPVVGGLEGLNFIPATLAAIAKSITGAYLSTSGNAFTTRTASQIVQENFNPGEADVPSGPLFGVQFSQLPCSDFSSRFSGNNSPGPHRSPLGLAADPGGMPLYKDGINVGGVGVISDGVYGLDKFIGDFDTDTDEIIATAATVGYAAPLEIRADQITLVGKTARYSDTFVSDLLSVPEDRKSLTQLSSEGAGSLVSVPGYFDNAGVKAGTTFGLADSGIRPADSSVFKDGEGESLDAFVFVDERNQNRYPARDGSDMPGGIQDNRLKSEEVQILLNEAIGIANKSRAQIRVPVGTPARVTVTVVDTNGEIVGMARTRDGPVFGADVSIQKARTAALFSGTGRTDGGAPAEILRALPDPTYLQPMQGEIALSKLAVLEAPSPSLVDYISAVQNFLGDPLALESDGQIVAFADRSGGNLSRPNYPDGPKDGPPGPLSKPPGEWSIFSVGLQLDLVYNSIINHVAFVLGAEVPEVGQICTGNTGFISQGPFQQLNLFKNIANGIQIFPGSVPIFRGDTLIGGIGVSGDGVDQDDMISFLGVHQAGLRVGNGLGNAPPELRADQLEIPGQQVRLRYVNCPQVPFIDSAETEVCNGL